MTLNQGRIQDFPQEDPVRAKRVTESGVLGVPQKNFESWRLKKNDLQPFLSFMGEKLIYLIIYSF